MYQGMSDLNINDVQPSKKLDKLALFPKQHPVKFDQSVDSNIITHKPPVIALTPYEQIPYQFREMPCPQFESPHDAHYMQVCLIGATNAGKSAIYNRLINKGIDQQSQQNQYEEQQHSVKQFSAVSPKANTTDQSRVGLFTDLEKKTQICFHDTPGATYIKYGKFYSRHLITQAWSLLYRCDQAVFIVDSVKKLNEQVRAAVKRLKKSKQTQTQRRNRKSANIQAWMGQRPEQLPQELIQQENKQADEPTQIPAVLVMNKVDLVTNKRKMRALQHQLEDLGQFDHVFFVSAQTGFGIEQLKRFLVQKAQRMPWQHHPMLKSQGSQLIKTQQLLKAQIFKHYHQQIPHQIAIRTVAMVPKSDGSLRVDFQIYAKSNVQRKMLLGEKGRILDKVRQNTIVEMQRLMQRPIVATILVRLRSQKLEHMRDKQFMDLTK